MSTVASGPELCTNEWYRTASARPRRDIRSCWTAMERSVPVAVPTPLPMQPGRPWTSSASGIKYSDGTR